MALWGLERIIPPGWFRSRHEEPVADHAPVQESVSWLRMGFPSRLPGEKPNNAMSLPPPPPPPKPEIREAHLALQSLEAAVGRAKVAWNRTQLQDALNSIDYWRKEIDRVLVQGPEKA